MFKLLDKVFITICYTLFFAWTVVLIGVFLKGVLGMFGALLLYPLILLGII